MLELATSTQRRFLLKIGSMEIVLLLALSPLVLLASTTATTYARTRITSTIFEDGFESGNFSMWDEVVNYSWHYYNISTADPREGNYHANLTKSHDSNKMGYLRKLISPTQTSVYARFYWKAVTKAVVLSTLFSIYDDEGMHSSNWYVDLQYDGALGWALYGLDANGTWWRVWNGTSIINEGQWYCIELFTEQSATANHTLWIDGIQTLKVMSNESDHSNIEWMLLRGGGGWSTERTIFDSVVFADTYIGPIPEVDVVPPSSFDLGHNNTVAGESTLFSCRWWDSVGLSGYVFGTNNSGVWVNSTWVSFGGSVWSNVSETLTASVGVVVQYRFYANDTSDNWNQTVLGSFVVTSAPHNIAIVGVWMNRTIVAKAMPTGVTVEVANLGALHEICNVTVYANSTIVGMFTNLALPSGNSTIVRFDWNTTDFALGQYIISAEATPVPGENDTDDNTGIFGWVLVTIPGDVDGDRDVDIYDIVRMVGAYGTSIPDPAYDIYSDLDDDGDVDIYDIVIAAGNYGKKW